MSHSIRRILLFFMLFAALVTACSGDDDVDDAALGDNPNIDQLDVGPDTQGDGGETTTVPGDDVEPTVLGSAKFSRVFVAPNGNDGKSGENPANAVKTIDRAISALNPGGTVVFQPGTYPPLRIINKSGASGAPIRIEASGQVEFRDRDYKSGAGILIRDSKHIEVIGMRTRRSLWGIYMENSHHVTLRSNDVGDVGQEGIRVKAGSSNVRIEGNTVADTGRRTDKGHANGEGIYIGTGTPAGVDHVKNVTVINNRILRVTDEAVDVKRPSTNVDIIGNTISEVKTQTSGAIVVHLGGDQGGDPRVNIERNVIRNVTRVSQWKDGNCIVSQVTVRIVNNVLHNCQHRGVFLKGSGGTATIMHNTLINTGDVGTVVDEGRGMRVVSENNLGVGGDKNRNAGADVFVDPNRSNYRLKDGVAGQFASAPNKGVSNDLTGSRRPGSGPVTFGAVEVAAGTQAVATTAAPTTAAPATTAPATNESAAAAPKAAPKAKSPTTTRPVQQKQAAPNKTASPVTTKVTPAKPAPKKATASQAAPKATTPASSSSSTGSPNTGSRNATPANPASANGPTAVTPGAQAALPDGSASPVRSYPGAGPRTPLSGPVGSVGRTLGEPAAAGPLGNPGDDAVAPGDDRASCFNSFVCIWAPFL